MKDLIMEFAISEYKKIKKNQSLRPQEKLYNLSMPLLAMATLKETDNDYYKMIFSDMNQILSSQKEVSQIEKSWQLWMLGRMAVGRCCRNDYRAMIAGY